MHCIHLSLFLAAVFADAQIFLPIQYPSCSGCCWSAYFSPSSWVSCHSRGTNPGVLHPFVYRTWPSSSIPWMSLFTSLLLNLLFDGVHHLKIFFSFKLSSSHTDFLGLANGCTAVIGVVMSIFFLSTQQLSDSYVSPIVGPASTISYLLHVYNV